MRSQLGLIDDGPEHIAPSLEILLKEVRRRCELRPRLEAEWGRLLTDAEFIEVAERTGLKI